ncbi:MAG: glutamate--tRNA ligase [Candidatus Micrarchaeia archaeon]
MDEELIRKYAIKNAIDYGKASVSSVLGKVISKLGNDEKGNIQDIKAKVMIVVEQVNKEPRSKIEQEYQAYKDEFEKEEKIKVEQTAKPKMVLENAVYGSFATRYAPEPNGYMHIGNAKAAILAEEFAKIYKGKIFLYFDDTNPEKERSEYVQAMHDDTSWLGIKFSGEYYASDNIETIYKYAEQAIANGKAYVCTCTPEQMKKDRFDMHECVHRSQSPETNAELFRKMLSGGFEEGEAVLRFKGDMHAQNTVMRDPTIMRIKKHEHYRQGNKYIVWPTYDFNTPIMDSIHGITDPIRSKEYELRNELYYAVLDAIGLRKPTMHLEARLVIKNNITHKRVLKTLISEGKLSGYDDPRLVTIASLKRRGIQPQAIREFVLRFGMSKVDSKVSLSMLLDENRGIIDPIAKRLFYVEEPVKVVVKDAVPQSISLKMHPTSNLGTRNYNIGNTFYISKSDANMKEGEIVRLKDLYDIRIESADGNGIVATMSKSQDSQQVRKIQWVADGSNERCTILIPGDPLNDNGTFNPDSLTESKGLIESAISSMPKGTILQLERFGYAIIDDPESKRLIFISK